MQKSAILEGFQEKRNKFFEWRVSLAPVRKIGLAVLMALITGIFAQIRFPIPFSPVPVTGQTFAVMLAGVFLGKNWGGISQAIYITLGAAGVPWFAGMTGGLGVLASPAGGYIIGFVLAAMFIGYISDNFVNARNLIPMSGVMLLANFALIHIPGLIYMAIFFHSTTGSISLWHLISIGTLPFIVGDVAKIVAAAAVTKLFTPNKSYK